MIFYHKRIADRHKHELRLIRIAIRQEELHRRALELQRQCKKIT